MTELVTLGIALIGAAGTVISAYLVARVNRVQRTVDGHTDKLEARLDEARQALSAVESQAP